MKEELFLKFRRSGKVEDYLKYREEVSKEFIENDKKIAGVYLLLTLLSFYRHRSNIKRLIRGEESKIRFKKK